MERKVIQQIQGIRTQDGAGVQLVRVLGHNNVYNYDPVLMLDSFDSTDPAEYRAGFPTHPHRGIETVSYIAQGMMTHRDNLGNESTITNGEAQWLTAGSGAFHSEMLPGKGRLLGAQLWLNLPAKDKMCPPAYHSITSKEIQEIKLPDALLRLVTGTYKEYKGFQGKYLPLDYYDIRINPGGTVTLDTDNHRSVMIFTLLGNVVIGGKMVKEKTAAKLSEGDSVTITADANGAEILFISSEQLEEPIAWYGPIVMNNRSEIRTAIRELDEGTFIKNKTKYQ